MTTKDLLLLIVSLQIVPVAEAHSPPQAVKLFPGTPAAARSTVPFWFTGTWHDEEPGLTGQVPISATPNIGAYTFTWPMPVAPGAPWISIVALNGADGRAGEHPLRQANAVNATRLNVSRRSCMTRRSAVESRISPAQAQWLRSHILAWARVLA